MKLLSLLIGLVSFAAMAQEENEILRVRALRDRFDQQVKVTVFPNPSLDGKISVAADEGSSVIVYDLSGNEVFSSSNSMGETSISALNPGTYILVVSKNGIIQKEKIVVL